MTALLRLLLAALVAVPPTLLVAGAAGSTGPQDLVAPRPHVDDVGGVDPVQREGRT